MTLKHLFGATLLLCLSNPTFAQTCTDAPSGTGLQLLCGARHAGPGAIDLNSKGVSTFSVGLTRDNGATYTNTATVGETLQIRGEVRPEPGDAGMTGDIFVVDRIAGTSTFTMKNQAGLWEPWPGAVDDLVPFLEDVPLNAPIQVDMFSGTLAVAAEHRFFLGYLPSSGALRYHFSGLPVSITEPTQSPLEEATDYFAAKINNDVVAYCLACHISGGQADGLSVHKFVPGSDAGALSTNFEQFRTLFRARGKVYILTKVSGGNSHVGGVVLPPSSFQYMELEILLDMLAGL
jgi:hypothetical protein